MTRDATVGLFLPSTIENRMRLLDHASRLLQGEIANSEKATDGLRSAYASFLVELRSFLSQNKGWLARSLNTTADTLDDFYRQFAEYRQDFVSAGGKTLSSGFAAANKPTDIKNILYAGVAGVGLGFLAWFLSRR